MISLKPTDDMDLVRQIVTIPDIWERLADGVDSKGYYPNTDESNQWMLVINDEEIVGIIYIHCDTSCSIGFHPYLLPEHRKHGREMVKVFFNWFTETIPKEYVKINAVIPECFGSAINFAKKVGFKKEGVCRNSYTRSDKVYNRIMLGITRDEVTEWAA